MADEPAAADGAVISVDRLARAAKYAAAQAGQVWLRLEDFGLRVDYSVGDRWARGQVVLWADFANEGAIKAAIDAAVASLAVVR
jgi:hypothetical protein